MQLKTILNRVERHKSFVYGEPRWADETHSTIEVPIEPRANGRPVCSGCGQRRPGYDRLRPRRFEFVPLWQIAVVWVYALRRVNCPRCGIVVERVPWSTGKSRLTTTYQWFLAGWARRLSWQEVATVFHTTWEHVRDSVRYAVRWGLVHRDLQGVTAIGVDEIQWRRGHRYLTLVYQIDAGCRRLLWIGRERTEESLRHGLELLGENFCEGLRYVCSDMWQPYLQVLAEQAGGAIHVLDRFHIMKQLGEAIDQVRAGEARRMKHDGYEPVLKHSRWCLLKRPENLTDRQTVKLRELLKYNLRAVRAYLHREDFQRFWEYQSPAWAGKFLDEWCGRVMRSRLEPLKKVARSLRKHHELLLSWFRAKGTISAGIVEGFNNKAKLTMRKSYGFREYETIELALYHQLGQLPQPDFNHEFC
ncbi:MAG: ISL3 family transposase [Planctomycetaceae bacterium]|nr:ISL3 family transposase [Planctomycetaceae bacterium]